MNAETQAGINAAHQIHQLTPASRAIPFPQFMQALTELVNRNPEVRKLVAKAVMNEHELLVRQSGGDPNAVFDGMFTHLQSYHQPSREISKSAADRSPYDQIASLPIPKMFKTPATYNNS